MGRSSESSGSTWAARCTCCCCAVMALVSGILVGVYVTPRDPIWQVGGLRLKSITPPSPGGSGSELRLEFAATVTVRNPNLIGASTEPGAFTVFYEDTKLGSSVIEEMEIDGKSSTSVDVLVPVADLPVEVGQAMLENVAKNGGLLTTKSRATVLAKLPLFKVTSASAFSFEATSVTTCTMTADINKLPEFAARNCTSTSTSGYSLPDL